MGLLKTITDVLLNLKSIFLMPSPKLAKKNFRSAIHKLNLSKSQQDDNVNIVIARNDYSVIAAHDFAKQKDSHFIVDLTNLPSTEHIEQTEFIEALKNANLLFTGNRAVAKLLENELKRHINISRHTTEILPFDKYIDLKKVFHLIDDVQIILFDSRNENISRSDYKKHLHKQFGFLSLLLQNLPRQTHIIVTGSKQESKYFSQYSQQFEQLDATSRIHFYTENLASIKYPVDHANVDLAIIIEEDGYSIPDQYYKYLHEEVVIFSSSFAESNQLITSAEIGKTFETLDIEQWSTEIRAFLNLSLNKRSQYAHNITIQKSKINWQKEAEHFYSSINNNLAQPINTATSIYIVDLSLETISSRTDNICNILKDYNPKITVVTPNLPIAHTPMTNGVNYIKVSNNL